MAAFLIHYWTLFGNTMDGCRDRLIVWAFDWAEDHLPERFM